MTQWCALLYFSRRAETDSPFSYVQHNADSAVMVMHPDTAASLAGNFIMHNARQGKGCPSPYSLCAMGMNCDSLWVAGVWVLDGASAVLEENDITDNGAKAIQVDSESRELVTVDGDQWATE